MVKAFSILLLPYCVIPVSVVNYFVDCHGSFGSQIHRAMYAVNQALFHELIR